MLCILLQVHRNRSVSESYIRTSHEVKITVHNNASLFMGHKYN